MNPFICLTVTTVVVVEIWSQSLTNYCNNCTVTVASSISAEQPESCGDHKDSLTSIESCPVQYPLLVRTYRTSTRTISLLLWDRACDVMLYGAIIERQMYSI